MGELSDVAFVMADEPKKARKSTPVERAEPASGDDRLQVIYDAETLIRGAKLWFGVSRPRVAAVLKIHKTDMATREQVENWLKG